MAFEKQKEEKERIKITREERITEKYWVLYCIIKILLFVWKVFAIVTILPFKNNLVTQNLEQAIFSGFNALYHPVWRPYSNFQLHDGYCHTDMPSGLQAKHLQNWRQTKCACPPEFLQPWHQHPHSHPGLNFGIKEILLNPHQFGCQSPSAIPQRYLPHPSPSLPCLCHCPDPGLNIRLVLLEFPNCSELALTHFLSTPTFK